MTLKSAKAAWPDAVFQRTSDGDGAALVRIIRGKIDLMVVHADEDDPAAPINWTRTIRFIETFHSACKTAAGIHPGMRLRDAEQRLGKVAEIMQSEIESRQYVRFSLQPPRLLFRLDYSGVFGPGARRTTKFAPGARLLSIAVTPE